MTQPSPKEVIQLRFTEGLFKIWLLRIIRTSCLEHDNFPFTQIPRVCVYLILQISCFVTLNDSFSSEVRLALNLLGKTNGSRVTCGETIMIIVIIFIQKSLPVSMRCISNRNRTGALLRCKEEDVAGYCCRDVSIRQLN